MLDDNQLEWLGKILSESVKEGFTGSIQINMFQGGIANIVKQESIKPPKFQ